MILFWRNNGTFHGHPGVTGATWTQLLIKSLTSEYLNELYV
jgi:hypothetical protein